MMPARKVGSLSKHRRQGKLNRSLKALLSILEGQRPYYEDFIRIHRIVFDCDPDPSEVPHDFPYNGEVVEDE